MNMRNLTFLTCAGLAFAAAVPAQTPPPAPVDLDAVKLEQVAPVQWAPGSVISRSDADVAGEQAGKLVQIAEVGERVAQGAVLARIDDRQLKLAVEEAQASRSRILAQRAYTRAQETRLSQLAGQGTVSRAQADEVASQARMIDQELASAEVSLRQAKLRLDNAVVRAPFAGTVVARLLDVGEYLSPGSAVVRLVDTHRPEIEVRAPVALTEFARPGQHVEVRHRGQMLRGAIRAWVPVGDAVSRQFELRVALDEAELPIGAAVEVGLPSSEPREALTVSRDALVLRPGERYVLRVGEGGTTQRVDVEPGGGKGDRIEVVGALQPGDSLVVRGAERLRPGQTVRVAGATPAAASTAASIEDS